MSTYRRPDASMSLLNDLWYQPVDGDYGLASPPQQRSRPAALARSGIVLVVSVTLGVLLSGAIFGLRGPAQALRSSRDLLISEITERTDSADQLAQTNADLDAQIADLQEQVLAARHPELLAELDLTGTVAGTLPVVGPGLVVELTDGPDGAEVPEDRVQDVDLQLVVNGLWASGAEAIAVNGQRITSLSAIRSASQVVLVDLVPLSSPYTIEAVGDPGSLQSTFAATQAASHLGLLSSGYGIGVQIRSAQDLSLAGVSSAVLRYAVEAGVASSTTNDQEGSP
ncbi:DUF881 domain-containing protein [Actinotalea sp. M2MS4P-6]|uniref:DUF881 domain-containing protein n=1 Tax=Actinotalea sp. M2MS4P-6 TaxID=2983762 RepID=UPI0021E39F1F|nr:DUF881 domain-containing protein [Actinotalea sp. M2MS4P-6]MCV2394633.1 DUF881 domain-containing protein [Actinotalea sp. M2MS4P-6]